MLGTLTVTAAEGVSSIIDQGYDGSWDSKNLKGDARKSGSNDVWTAPEVVEVTLGATGMSPDSLNLTAGTGYKLKIKNEGSTDQVWQAEDFLKKCVVRKIMDATAEVKIWYLSTLILKPGTTDEPSFFEFYVVPVAAGSFDMESRNAAGEEFTGTIAVAGTNCTACTTRSEWLNSISKDQWVTAAANPIVITIGEGGEGKGTYWFDPTTGISLEQGKPYVIRAVAEASNQLKHYVTFKGDSTNPNDFVLSVASLGVKTAMAGLIAPHIDDMELLVPDGVNTLTIDWYIVPVIPGTYNYECTLSTGETDHKSAGMYGTLTVTETAGLSSTIDAEYDSDWDEANLKGDARKSGSNEVWTTAEAVEVTFSGNGMSPTELSFVKDKGYKLKIINDHSDEATWEAKEFLKDCVFRKMMDAIAEVKVWYLTRLELMPKGDEANYFELYIVPTEVGSYVMRGGDSVGTILVAETAAATTTAASGATDTTAASGATDTTAASEIVFSGASTFSLTATFMVLALALFSS
jgi:uncharacterized cupredoxin-like copper-binding protein